VRQEGADRVEPVEIIKGRFDAGVLFLCDHASAQLPEQYGCLGLDPAQFTRHIAYDIGAQDVTRALAAHFNAPAVMTRFSRLLIDPNRGADDPTLVMHLSDGAIIPANASADAAEIAQRRQLYWQPYRDQVRMMLDAMSAQGPIPAIVSLHSFTPIWKGVARPWEVGILWDRDPRLAMPLLEALQAAGLSVGDNEPYDGALEGDTLYEHGTQRGLAHVLIEVRQDLIAHSHTAHAWAERLAHVLAPLLARQEMHEIVFFGSRCHR
jgi:predicted N-formylglutamate amidohydrolase